MDDACDAVMYLGPGCVPPPLADNIRLQYQYADNTNHIIDPYFNIAQNYGYANYTFQTNQGPSFPAHQFLLSGTSAPVKYNDPSGDWTWFDTENVFGSSGSSGCPAPSGAYTIEIDPNFVQHQIFPCYEHATLTDLLDAATPALTWRWYGNSSNDSLWNAPNAVSHLCGTVQNGACTGSDWTGSAPKIALNIGQLLYDLGDNTNGACNLPNVSWVIPDGHWSDHPGGAAGTITDGGPSWVAAIVNGVGGKGNTGGSFPTQCNYWSNTAVIIVWDDWGGWYDHVLPWNCDSSGNCGGYPNATGKQYVYGFRVPMLVVSPYTKAGYVSGDIRTQSKNPPYVHDFGSILNFIEYAFGQGGAPLAEISPNYHYADYFAPDGPNNPKCAGQCPYGLSDFFGGFKTQRNFTFINGAKYATNCFIYPTASGCFGGTFTAMDPDNDAVDQ